MKDFYVHKGIISRTNRVEFVSDRMSYLILRGCWSDIIVLMCKLSNRSDNVDINMAWECMNRKKNYFYQLLNVHGVNDVRQPEIHTTKTLLLESSFFRLRLLSNKWKRYITNSMEHSP
jgi:hypothetical protein